MAKKINAKSMVLVDITCTILFTVFSVLYLSSFQADLLWYAQRVLSEGATEYSVAVGTAVITFVALLLRTIVKRFHPYNQRITPALSFLPSALLLAVVTDFHTVSSTRLEYGNAIILSIIILILYVSVVWLESKVNPFDQDPAEKGWGVNTFCLNMATMLLVLSIVAMVGNTDRVEHQRLHVERTILSGDSKKALELTKRSCQADSAQVMLRAYALGKHTNMGGLFFSNFNQGSSSLLFPTPVNNLKLLTISSEKIYSMLGGRPAKGMGTKEMLKVLERNNRLTETGYQYLLIAYLLDRDLESFAKCLSKCYDAGEPLPRNYAEAMVLYKERNPRAYVPYDLGSAPKRYKEYRLMADAIKQGKKVFPDGTPIMFDSMMRKWGETYWYYETPSGLPKGEEMEK